MNSRILDREFGKNDPPVIVTRTEFNDLRGSFQEIYKNDWLLQNTNHEVVFPQANFSESKKDVFRGLHFSNASQGQAKFVSCISGTIEDFVVDLRENSKSYLKVHRIELSATNHESIYIPKGFAHGFRAKTDASVLYLVSSKYDPISEFCINPLDSSLGLNIQNSSDLVMSEKDRTAPTISQLESMGILPIRK